MRIGEWLSRVPYESRVYLLTEITESGRQGGVFVEERMLNFFFSMDTPVDPWWVLRWNES